MVPVQVFQQCVQSNPVDRPSSTDLFNQLRAIANSANLFSRDSTAHYKQIKVDSVGSPIKGPRADLIFGAKRTSSQSSRWSRSPSSTDAMAFPYGGGGGSVAMLPPEPYSGGFPRRPGSLASAGGHPTRPPRSPRSASMMPNLNSAGSTGLAPSSADSIPRGESQNLYGDYARSPTGDGRPGGPFHPRSGPNGVYGAAISPTWSDRSPLMGDHRPRTYPGSQAMAGLPDSRLAYMSGPFSDQSGAEWGGPNSGPNPAPPPRYVTSGDSVHAPQHHAAQQHAAAQQQQHMLHGVHTMPPLNFYGRITPATSAGSIPASGPASGGSHLMYTAEGRPMSGGSAHMMIDPRTNSVHSAAHRLGPRGLSWAGDAQSQSGDAMSPSGRGSALSPGAQSPPAHVAGIPLGASSTGAPGVRQGIPYSAVFSNPTAQMEDGDETVPEEGDTTSDESRTEDEERRARPRRKPGKALTEQESAQKVLLDADSGESLPERRQQQSGSVDSFNLDLGNSSNLQRLLQKQRGVGKGGEGGAAAAGVASEGSQAAVDDARRVAGTTIPEASTMDGPIDAVPPAAPQPRRRQPRPRPAVIGRTLSGLRSSSGGACGGSSVSGGGRADTADSTLGTPGGDDLPSAIHSTNTVTLNLWGNNSFAHSLMHDSRDAVDASFATDAERGYPAQSIMESMRRMASLAGGDSSVMQRAIGGVSNMSGSGRLDRTAGTSDVADSLVAATGSRGGLPQHPRTRHAPAAGAERTLDALAGAEAAAAAATAPPPRPPPHNAVADVYDTLMRTPSLPSARAHDTRSHNASSVSFTKTHDADHASTEAPGSASAVPPSPLAATQTFPRTPRTSSYTHSLSLTPSSTSRQPHNTTTLSQSFLTTTMPFNSPLLHTTQPPPDSPRPQSPPPKLLFAPGGKHAQQLSPSPLNASALRSMNTRASAGHSAVSRFFAVPSRGGEEESAMQGVSAWLKDLQPGTPPSPPASPPPLSSAASGVDSRSRQARPKSQNDDRGRSRTVGAGAGAGAERSGRVRARGGDRAKGRSGADT